MQKQWTNALSSPEGIGSAYSGDSTANDYVTKRFASELMALLHEKQVASVQSVFDRDRPASSLEIAPGPGRITRDLKPSGKLTCLEYNEGMIRCGKSVCSSAIDWFQGDAFDLPFEREFEFVYSFRFIRHFRRTDRFRLYEQIRKVVKARGRLMFDAVNERVSRPLREKRPSEYPIYDELYSDLESLKSEVREAGFRMESAFAVQRWFPLQCHVQNLVGPRNQTLNRWILHALERVPFGQPLEWIVVCQCE